MVCASPSTSSVKLSFFRSLTSAPFLSRTTAGITTSLACTLSVPAEPLVGMSAGSLVLGGDAFDVVKTGFDSCAPAAAPATHSSPANPALHRLNFIYLQSLVL